MAQSLPFNRNVPGAFPEINATPKRAVRVGYTQSYISTPNAVHTTKSSG